MTFPSGACFTKEDLNGTPRARKDHIQRALDRHDILHLKNGLYIETSSYLNEPDKTKLAEYIASQLYAPSYISLEYVLMKYHLLFRVENAPLILTSITSKTTRTFTNFAGNFTYSHVKPSIYFGFEEVRTYRIATKAKALFDYFYLNVDLDCRNEKHLRHQLFEESPLQWSNFSEEDFIQFDRYVWDSNSFKMMTIRRVMERYFEGKKFDRWAKALLA